MTGNPFKSPEGFVRYIPNENEDGEQESLRDGFRVFCYALHCFIIIFIIFAMLLNIIDTGYRIEWESVAFIFILMTLFAMEMLAYLFEKRKVEILLGLFWMLICGCILFFAYDTLSSNLRLVGKYPNRGSHLTTLIPLILLGIYSLFCGSYRIRGFSNPLFSAKKDKVIVETIFTREIEARVLFFIVSIVLNIIAIAMVNHYVRDLGESEYSILPVIFVLIILEFAFLCVPSRIIEVVLGAVLFSMSAYAMLNLWEILWYSENQQRPIMLAVQFTMAICWIFYGWTRIWGGVYVRESV